MRFSGGIGIFGVLGKVAVFLCDCGVVLLLLLLLVVEEMMTVIVAWLWRRCGGFGMELAGLLGFGGTGFDLMVSVVL